MSSAIGPSGHKNTYHLGTLEGNWVEDRSALGRSEVEDRTFRGLSEAKASFASKDGSTAKPDRAYIPSAPRELLFGQAAASTNPADVWVTNSQLSWGVGASATAKKKGYCGRLDVSGASASAAAAPVVPASELLSGSRHLHTVAGDKARARQQELDDDEPFRTTKQATLDLTASRIQRGECGTTPRREVRQKGGDISNSLNGPANKLNLRQ